MRESIRQFFYKTINFDFSIGRTIGRSLIIFLLFTGLAEKVSGQIQRYPANVTPVLGTPYSPFLSDYTDPAKNQLTANIIFNDFNESTWTFKLRLTIESADIRLQTVNGFTPSTPITVSPGVLTQIKAEQWTEYFDFNNLNVAGPGVEVLRNTGRLPEGMYSFCLEVLDYQTGDVLSRQSCMNVWIQLMDPPRLISPVCGAYQDPKFTQVQFQWQLFNTQSPNATLGTEYKLTLWEITDPGANPLTAVMNGQALQVFQSDPVQMTNFVYGPSEPLLELGKAYIYRVQATSPDGKDRFKNNGFSEFCHFYYGWPTGGNIELRNPPAGGGFSKEDVPYISWNAPDNLLPNQSISYEIEIMELEEDQSAQEGYNQNTPWFFYQRPPTLQTHGGAHNLPALKKGAEYAWKIKAFTDQQEIADSEVSNFFGPSLVERFYALGHRVQVDYINGKDVTNLSGGGKVRLTNNLDDWTEFTFENITLEDNGGYWVMTGGEIIITPDQPKYITLTPDNSVNGEARYELTRYRLTKDGLYSYGTVLWDLPFPTLSEEKAVVKSNAGWSNFNNFKVYTALGLPEGENRFDLLDPFSFTLDIDKSSLIYVNENTFRFEFDGEILAPDKVRRFLEDRVAFTFQGVGQLFHIEGSTSIFSNPIRPLRKSDIWLKPSSYTIDLSESTSWGSHSSLPEWKGIELLSYEISYDLSPDHYGQLRFENKLNRTYDMTAGDNGAWIGSGGLSLDVSSDYSAEDMEMWFQTFPASPQELKLTIEDNTVSDDSYFSGKFLIPVVSQTRKFGFRIPVNNLGFEKGYLTDLKDTRFTFNKDRGDQELFITIKRAVLSGNEKITMTIDLEWPALGITLSGLQGFKAWGDYSIGFASKNGTVALTERANATLSGYPVTLGIIGAGSNDGHYAFATMVDIVLGEDVSGEGQQPTANIYSMAANPFVPEDATGEIGTSQEEQVPLEEAAADIESDFENLEEDLFQNLSSNTDAIVAGIESLQSELAGGGHEVYAPEDIFTGESTITFESEGEPAALQEYDSEQKDIAREIAEGLVQELTTMMLQPLQDRIDSLNEEIEGSVNGFVENVNGEVENKINSLITSIANELIDKLQNDKIDVSPYINELALETGRTITAEARNSINQAVSQNILAQVETMLQENVMGRVNQHIVEHGTEAVYATLTGSGDVDNALEDLIAGIPGVAGDILQDAASLVSLENLESTVKGLGEDVITGFDVRSVTLEIRGHAEGVIRQAIQDAATNAVGDLASEYGAEAGLPGFGGESDIPVDFVGMGSRLAQGDVQGAFALDPVHVKLNTPVVQLDGYVQYTPENPTYGDVWTGDINMLIKVPKPFALNAVYINGRKDDIPYWFVQITPPKGEGDEPYEIGAPLPKEAKPLPNPADIGIAKIVGASGRLYHHMREEGGTVVPDADMRYGAYMHFVFFDKGTNGKNMRLEVAGEINSKENGDFTIAFDGNVQLQNGTAKVNEIDQYAAIIGTVEVAYNSAEKHFLGYAAVELNKPNVICAEGSLLVDVKPGKWRVALGSREERLVFVPGCMGWSPTGWLDLNESVAELGLGVQWSVEGKTPAIPLAIWKVRFGAEAGLAVGVLAAVRYRPDLKLIKAGVWADVWAKVIMEYRKAWKKKWKSKTLIDINLKGELIIYFVPKPSVLEGNLRGYVEVLGFRKKVNASVRKEI